jgi:tRNA (mo5U34)-methyltransferase
MSVANASGGQARVCPPSVPPCVGSTLSAVVSAVEIHKRVEEFPRWHYEFELGGVRTPIAEPQNRNRHAQRRRYFFDPLVRLSGGTLRGKRVLDLGCNAGFWSLCAIDAGCDFVLGIDGREMHIEQARLVFDVRDVDPDRYEFVHGDIRTLDLADRPPFDAVLCLGVLYHVADPLSLLAFAAERNSDLLIVDTTLHRAPGTSFLLARDSPDNPTGALGGGLVLVPTRGAVEAAVRELGYDVVTLKPRFTSWEGCFDYRVGTRRAFVAAKRTPLRGAGLEVEPQTRLRRAGDAAFSVLYPRARALRARLNRS